MENEVSNKVKSAIASLNDEQLNKVLEFVEDLRQNDLMNKRAEAAEESIKYGKVVSFEKFSQDFEAWKNKKASTR
ncbi:hypothetical protein [Roseivirga sp.]|jgi:hypothetical protein|uniref:hypothetical protein n=1 Tax=Roseivirga sp. TaxID=1964215 RepID=UPI000D7927B1|nr:hypothetical protein [Roseivirga sp.]MBO6495649.1 hypothetical protein [Roseivirga sp.]PWL31688.1 MAG: hypothetical protein DCO95_00450 [Roseivirga sp. XM-24bin3]